MESNVNENELQVNKKKIDPGNQLIGIHDDIINANILSFEHALETIQNKLSLPEYDGPDDFEESCENKKCTENAGPSCGNELVPVNIIDSVESKDANTCNMMHKNTVLSQNLKVMNHWNSFKSHSSLKQMTLDKYSFQTQNILLKSPPKSTCSIMIACSSSISYDSKSYSHDKVLFWRNPTFFQKESIVPSTLKSISSPMECNESSLYSTDKTAIKGVESTHQMRSDDDALDLEIEKAMEKYDIAMENNVENPDVIASLSGSQVDKNSPKNHVSIEKDPELFMESGVQTTPPCVHACNCLGYHVCDLFRGLDDKQCTKRRHIDALDLDTLHYVSKKSSLQKKNENIVASDFVQNEGNCNNDQEVPQCLNEMFPQQHKSLPKVSNDEDGVLCDKKEGLLTDQKGSSKTDRKYNDCESELNIEQKCRNSTSQLSFDSYLCNSLNPTEKESNKLKMLLPQEDLEESYLQLPNRSQENHSVQNNCFEDVLYENISRKENIISDVFINDKFNKRDSGKYSSLEDYEESKVLSPAATWGNCLEEERMIVPHDQDVPDIVDDLKDPDGLDSEDSRLWNGSFLWKNHVQKPHDEFLYLKPLSQKVRRIGLSRRDKPISLHPKKKQKF